MKASMAMKTVGTMPARRARASDWQQWAPRAAAAWSLLYGILGIAWAASGRGFPYANEAAADPLGPMVGRWGPGAAWVVVVLAGIPAAVMGMAMIRNLRGRIIRPVFLAAGGLLAGILSLGMTGLTLLESLGYVPFTLFRLLTGADTSYYLRLLVGAGVTLQLFCLLGGFLWLAATVVYARRSAGECVYCGRGERSARWQSPESAARWGRSAVYAAMAAPILYAFTRYAWVLGWPLGMTREYWQAGQEKGLWVSGLFLANFGLVGALLMLGLVQRWGETFPRWMMGLAGRRVPVGLAVVPAAIAAVVVFVGGIGVWSALPAMAANVVAAGATQSELTGALVFQVGPTLLFPLWGAALALGTLGYYFRRRGACKVCGKG